MASQCPLSLPRAKAADEPSLKASLASCASVTVSVVSHQQRHLIETLLANLGQCRPDNLARVVVTLNTAEETPASPADLDCDLIVQRNEVPLGFGANHNQAFRHCDTTWFAVLNPDLVFSRDPILPSLSRAGGRDGLLAPTILDSQGRLEDASRTVPTPAVVARRRIRSMLGPETTDFDWLAGMFMLIRSEAFRQIGGFDERYFMYCEDVDLCLRLQLAGWNLRRVAEASVVHDAQRASRRSLRHLGWHVSSLLRLWRSAVLRDYLAQRGAILARRSEAQAG
jgi:N-acetylglucosaminyl-diphospho-decaprenol L-rhamnosyltransferase